MAVWKRYKQKRVKRGDPNYDKGTWIAEGRVESVPYKKALPRETVKTAEQARAQDDEIRSQIRSGDYVARKTGFSDFVDQVYLPYCQTNLASYKTKVLETNSLKRFFKNRLINTITLSTCEEYKRWRKAQRVRCQKCENDIPHACDAPLVKNATVNCDLGTLFSIFDLAVADRKLKSNPMAFVPRLEVAEPRERFLSDDEKRRLLAALKEKFQLYCIVVIALLAGWRKQQILHLRKTDLAYGEQKVWTSKSKKKPKRKIVVGDAVWTLLTALAEVREDWLFLNPSGNRLVEFNYIWWKALDRAGITDFRFHDLRHSFATSLLENDVREFAIQHALNHSRIQTTQGYAHVQDEHLKRGLDRISEGLDLDLSAILTPSERVM
jgi:integrase